ncbi:MAG: DUF1302 domain-containing protein [Inquilinus sp.]|nr:DUF1302 domain-containing protein [Inquilinus sp.]
MRQNTAVNRRHPSTGWRTGVSLIALGTAALAATSAAAFEFDFGELSGSFDTTITAGASFRVEERDLALIGIVNQVDGVNGTRFSINGDDGDLNYDKGLISSALRATHELALGYNDFGLFTRFTYFYDFENASGDKTEFKDLTDAAIERVGKDFDLLDAYVYGGFEAGDVPIDFRLGNQVLSWGESTFIQNGVNVINPIDVNQIRIPGSEVRDALIPVTIADVDVGITDNLSVEGFYQIGWEETEIDAAGTYFSDNDFASPGGSFVFLTSTGIIDDPELVIQSTTQPGAVVPRGATREASDSGQYGLAVRYFAENLNETEFGGYFLNYHSRTPIISATNGTGAGLLGLGPNNYAASARYFTEYPEDIQLAGASFNTALESGLALQGEVSYRFDQPLQVDDVEILQSALAIPIAAACEGGDAPSCGALALLNTNPLLSSLGGVSANAADANYYATKFGQEVSGFREFDVVQAQVTATQAFGPIEALGVDQWVVVGELGVTHVLDMPSMSELILEGPNTPRPATANGATVSGVPQQTDGFPDPTSWGYRVRARFDMLNAIGPINVFPKLGFSHDVGGTTPLPIGNFVEDRASVSVGVDFTYQNSWSAGLQYTNFFAIGDDEFNTIRDRDFVSLNVKYSF